jgi:hypothetical protein
LRRTCEQQKTKRWFQEPKIETMRHGEILGLLSK